MPHDAVQDVLDVSPDTPLRVLIVDDSSVTRAVVRRAIRMAGNVDDRPVNIEEACDGQEALEKLRDAEFHVCFLDLNMPRMGGMEVASAVFADGSISTAIVVVSSESMRDKIDRLQRDGVRGYIRKPFAPEQIREMLHRLQSTETCPLRFVRRRDFRLIAGGAASREFARVRRA
ncbi:MAG: response regulator, partial [Planctomycetota bacterium]